MTLLPLTRDGDIDPVTKSDDASERLKGWRFPLSRYHLWDRSATGERLVVSPALFFPETHLTLRAMESLKDGHESKFVDLLATWECAENGEQRLRIDYSSTSDRRTTDRADSFVCQRRNRDLTSEHALSQLTHRYESFCADLEKLPAVSDLFPFLLSYAKLRTSQETILEGAMAVPERTVTLSPIHMKNILSTPLSQSLKSQMRSSKPPIEQTGYLSMDTCRRLIPLLPDDDNLRSMTLVGVWISGIDTLVHPMTVAACLRFHETLSIRDKATQEQAFLVLYYGIGEYSSKLYECSVEEHDPSTMFAIYSCRVLGRSSSSKRDTKIKWKRETVTHTIRSREGPAETKQSPGRQTPSLSSAELKPDGIDSEIFSDYVPFSFTAQRESGLKRNRIGEQILSASHSLPSTEPRSENRESKSMPEEDRSENCLSISAKQALSSRPTNESGYPKVFYCAPSGADQSEHICRSPSLRSRSSDEDFTFQERQNETSSDQVPCGTVRGNPFEDASAEPSSKEWQLCTQDEDRLSRSQHADLQLEVDMLKDKVALLEGQLAKILNERQRVAMSPSSSPESSPRSHSMAIVPVGDPRSSEPPQVQSDRILPPPTRTISFLPATASYDLSSLIESFLDSTLPDFDDHDSELEILSRKYLGKGVNC